MILHGQGFGELYVAAVVAPELRGSGLVPGKGNVPRTPPAPAAGRKGGGGNAPSLSTSGGWRWDGENVAESWAAGEWPKDQYGCYLVPQYFDLEGWSIP